MSAFVSCWPSKTACSKKERVADGRKWQSIITKHSKMVSVFPTATMPTTTAATVTATVLLQPQLPKIVY
jgi:hypothetical protein